MHRDWQTLLSALAGAQGFELRIAPSKAKIRLGSGMTNVTVAPARSEAEVRALYDWADIVVMPLRPNLHASGITVILEAIVLGIPIVCTDAGGLRDYFPGGEICFVPPCDPHALREAVKSLAGDEERHLEMAVAAQRRVIAGGLTTQGYADGYRNLSAMLLAPRAAAACVTPDAAAVRGKRSDADRLRAFVLLPHGFGAERWRKRFAGREIPGLNDALPFGYYRAASQRWSVVYSEDADENLATQYVRRGLSRALGLDLIHAWRNHRSLLAADAVWTHTERESLAAIALFHLVGRQPRPRIVAQCVWLFDRWNGFSWPRRAAYRWLLKGADIVTTLSPENREAARRIIPEIPTELVLFGVGSPEDMRAPRRKICHAPVRIAGLGGDMHRDWDILLRALGGQAKFKLTIASSKARLRPPRTRYERDRHGGSVRSGGEEPVRLGGPRRGFAQAQSACLRDYGHPGGGGVRRARNRERCRRPTGILFRRGSVLRAGRATREALREAAVRLAENPERRFRMTSRRNDACLRPGSPGRGTPSGTVS